MFAGNYDDHANAIAVGSLGNVYVTGASVGSGDSVDYANDQVCAKNRHKDLALLRRLADSRRGRRTRVVHNGVCRT
jgi:hypothetical protein